MNKNILRILAVLLLLNCCNMQEEDRILSYGEKQAAQISSQCWEKAFKNNPTSTTGNISAGIKANECMDQQIYQLLDSEFTQETQAAMTARYNAIRQQILDFYWDLRNDNKYCIPSCGTMQQIFNRGDWFKFQEKILGALLDLQKNQDAF